MLDGLSCINKDGNIIFVGNFDNFLNGMNNPCGVGYLCHGNKTGFFGNQCIE